MNRKSEIDNNVTANIYPNTKLNNFVVLLNFIPFCLRRILNLPHSKTKIIDLLIS